MQIVFTLMAVACRWVGVSHVTITTTIHTWLHRHRFEYHWKNIRTTDEMLSRSPLTQDNEVCSIKIEWVIQQFASCNLFEHSKTIAIFPPHEIILSERKCPCEFSCSHGVAGLLELESDVVAILQRTSAPRWFHLCELSCVHLRDCQLI